MKLLLLLFASLLFVSAVYAHDIDFNENDSCAVEGDLYVDDSGWGVPTRSGGPFQPDGTFCTIIEPEGCTWAGMEADVTVTAHDTPINYMQVRYMDTLTGLDSFSITYDDFGETVFVGYVFAQNPYHEEWADVEFYFPEIAADETRTFTFEADGPIWIGCPTYGQIPIDYIDFDYNPEIPEYPGMVMLAAIALAGIGLFILRKK